MTTLLAQTTDK